MFVVLRRFAELLITCVVLSAAVCAVSIAGMPSDYLTPVLSTAVGIFVFIQIYMLRNCYIDLDKVSHYFFINYSSYFLFGALTVAIYKLCSSTTYAWIFSITKFLKYLPYGFGTVYSAVVFHFIMAVVIIISPIGVGNANTNKKKKQEVTDESDESINMVL